jgi:hypothetical protein
MLVDGLGLHLVEALDPGQRLWPEPGGVETDPEAPVNAVPHHPGSSLKDESKSPPRQPPPLDSEFLGFCAARWAQMLYILTPAPPTPIRSQKTTS